MHRNRLRFQALLIGFPTILPFPDGSPSAPLFLRACSSFSLSFQQQGRFLQYLLRYYRSLVLLGILGDLQKKPEHSLLLGQGDRFFPGKTYIPDNLFRLYRRFSGSDPMLLQPFLRNTERLFHSGQMKPKFPAFCLPKKFQYCYCQTSLTVSERNDKGFYPAFGDVSHRFPFANRVHLHRSFFARLLDVFLQQESLGQ